MVKLKRRYFLVELISTDPVHKIEFRHVYREISDKIKTLYGEAGAGAFMYSSTASEVKAPAGMHIFKVFTHHTDMFSVAMTCVDSVNGQAVQLRCLAKSSTIRTVYRKAIRISQTRLSRAAIASKDQQALRYNSLKALQSISGHAIPEEGY
uniref:Ribonuclease P/MRP protein subunit POP5 n=1 Tax=Panagrellus redivivus TaxID=6233 RepID=A0A7E4VI59_PANRE